MTNLNSEICWQLREARRAAKLSQSVVAEEIGCKQSALSMFEQGDPTKLNEEAVHKLATKFKVDLKVVPKQVIGVEVGRPSGGFCPNPKCPTNHSYSVEGHDFWLPDLSAADPVGGRYCAMCGEVLERRCPNCGSAVHAGAICSLCGEPYVVG